MFEKYNLLTKFRMHLVKHVIQFGQNNSIFKISATNFIQLFWLLVINTNEVKNYVLNVLKHNLLNFEDLIGSKIMWQNETPLRAVPWVGKNNFHPKFFWFFFLWFNPLTLAIRGWPMTILGTLPPFPPRGGQKGGKTWNFKVFWTFWSLGPKP